MAAKPEDPRCDVAGLRVFVCVARLGSVSRAANELGRSQPGVSARLAGLEAAWGTRLFRRGRRGMTPTPEGARLLAGAERALQELAALDRAAGVAITSAGELRVGAGDALGRECLPRAIATLRGEQPSLGIRIREGTGPRLLDALRDGEIDLALLLRAPDRGADDGLDRQPLFESPIELLCPAGWAGSARRTTALSRLAGQPLVTLQPGSAFRLHLENAFRAAGLGFAPTVEVGNLSLVVRFVAAGLGVAPFPAIALGPADRAKPIERRRLAGIEPLRYERAVRARAPLTEVTRRLLELLGTEL